MYVKKHFKETAKSAMDEMVRYIRQEMSTILSNIKWMDDATRARAQKKLSTMKEYIGYPDELLQENLLDELFQVNLALPLPPHLPQGLEVSPVEHYQNGIEIGKWSTAYVWSKMREQVGAVGADGS
jgi:hypothetical protein